MKENETFNEKKKCKLGDPEFATIIMGQSPPSSSYNKLGQGLPFYQGNADFGLRSPIPTQWCSDPLKIAEKGDVLLSVRAPVGAVNVASQKCCIGRGLSAIRPGKVTISEYLYFKLLSERDRIDSYGSGSIFNSINKETLLTLEFNFHELSEQKAIATVLTKIQCAIEIQDKTTSILKEFKTAAMAKFFHEGLRREPLKSTTVGEIPKSWALVPISNFFLVGNGSTPSRKNKFYWEGGSFPWITSKKVHDIFITQAEEYVTPLAKKECHLPLVSKGSLVVAITGQGKTLGNVAKLEIDTCINQHLAYFTPKNEDVESNFLLAYLQTCYKDLRQAGSSGGSTKGALTCSFLATYLFPLPKIDEQIEIAGAWQNITARISISEQKKADLVSLFQSTLHQLMSGDLKVNEALEYLNKEVADV